MNFITSKNYTNEIDYTFGSLYNGYNENIKQINIYHKYNKKSDLQTIKIQTPKLLLTNDIIKTNKLVLNIDTCDIKILNFYNLINNTYNNIKKYIKKQIKKTKLSLFSIFNDNKMFLNIIDSRIFNVFDQDKNKITLENLKPGYQIKLIIEISNIWIDLNKNIYGINWNIKQIQTFDDIIQKCLILDSDEEEDIIKKEIIVQTCSFCNSICSVPSQFYNQIKGKGKGKGKGPPSRGKCSLDNQVNPIVENKTKPVDINNLRAIKPTLNITTTDLQNTIKKLKKTKIDNHIKNKIEERRKNLYD
tara:strand:- start:672 stop:1580 length:909 start_codon:yes stop_codon:yes gene_type:complete